MPTGTIKFINVEKMFGFISIENGKDIHFRLQALEPSLHLEELHAGMVVSFEVRQSEKGLTAAAVRRAGSQPVAKEQAKVGAAKFDQRQTSGRFLNPYNFVRYLPEPSSSPDDDPAVRRMGRCQPPRHDEVVGLSGKVTCDLTACTPIFFSDRQPVRMEGEHRDHPVYQFYSLNGKKTIPASGLRGPVRTVFESITNACFAHLDNKPLSYRLEPGRAGSLVPARIEEKNGVWELRLLTGTAQLTTTGKPDELYPAALRAYAALKPSGKNNSNPPLPPVDLKPLGKSNHISELHGEECWAVLVRSKFPPAWRVIAVAATQAGATSILSQAKNNLSPQTKTLVCSGYLCITNQNIDNKASERFFFDYAPGRAKMIPLSEEARRKYSDLLADYQGRHSEEVEERVRLKLDSRLPVPGQKDKPGFSRFILNRPERHPRDGDLVYAMLRGVWPNVQLAYIAPVSIPRVAYTHGPGDLLPAHVRHCTTYDALCPACRTFGWANSSETGRRRGREAYRGRVRFSSGTLTHPISHPPMRLAILGSPKPTTTRFYLTGPDGKPGKGRSDSEAGYDGNEGTNRLRGRKVYRNFEPDDQYSLAENESGQNRTIEDPEGPGAKFQFTVWFSNLFPEELGALLWALTLKGKGVHKLGLGKPLGLGSAEISIVSLDIDDLAQRYTSLDNIAPAAKPDPNAFMACFEKAMTRRYNPQGFQPPAVDVSQLFLNLDPIIDLLSLLGPSSPGLPIHYPFSPDQDSNGSFEWFVGNKRLNGPRIELDMASEDEGLPLINKRGETR